jgi:hypothetical protein
MDGVSVTLPYVVCLGSGEIHLALTMPGVQNDVDIMYLYIFGYLDLKVQRSACEHPSHCYSARTVFQVSKICAFDKSIVYIQKYSY